MKIKTSTRKIIDVHEWDALVRKTYKRPYMFQQQEGCRDRGVVWLKVPEVEYKAKMNLNIFGVRFDTWLKRDPEKPLKNQTTSFQLELWWERYFYPDVQLLANDLYTKGLLPRGEYGIEVDW